MIQKLLLGWLFTLGGIKGKARQGIINKSIICSISIQLYVHLCCRAQVAQILNTTDVDDAWEIFVYLP